MSCLRKGSTLLSLFLFWSGSPVPGQTRELYPNTPDEVIVKRAAQQAKPLWQIPLGPALVEEMTSLGPDKLLVGLRKDFPGLPNLDYLLVDKARGDVLWRYSREKVKGEFDTLLVLEDLLLFRVEAKKNASLLALDPRTGKEKWTVSVNGEQVTFIPLLGAGLSLAVNPGPSSVELTAVDLDTGREVWKKVAAAANGSHLPQPLPVGEDVLLFYEGLERISAKDGRSVYSRPDIRCGTSSPPPQIDGDLIWAVDSGNRLYALDAATGDVRWVAPLPDRNLYTQLYPLGRNLYLRGLNPPDNHFVASLNPDSRQIVWTWSGREASVSNLIESDGILYFGTPSSLVAVKTRDGSEVFSIQVTKTGRAFPVRLRKIADRIIYIGELVVAAYDAATGKTAYRHGMSPGSQELHLNGLDAAAPDLKEALQEAGKAGPGDKEAVRMVSFALAEMSRYQNLARDYASRAASSAGSGDALGSSLSSTRARFAQHEASLQATMAAAISVTHLVMMYRQFLYARSIKTFLERQSLFRKSILSSYAQAESEDFVYRPHLIYRDVADSFSALSMVHLPTGRRSETVLSPLYLSYGLWQVVDFQKGIVYHSNIGMDPTRYELSESRSYYPYKKARTVNTFLIAQPTKLSP